MCTVHTGTVLTVREVAMVYELRTYWAAPGKVDAMHQRFANHTDALFRKHGMAIIAYWSPQGGRELHGDLVYVLGFPSQAARDAAWTAFRDDPVWQAAKAESERDGTLVEKLDSVIMHATSYSPLQ